MDKMKKSPKSNINLDKKNPVLWLVLALLFVTAGIAILDMKKGSISGLVVDEQPVQKSAAVNSCQGYCGSQPAGSSCFCDAVCEIRGDCCLDYAPKCKP